jgi:hypothetical protein
MTKHSYISMVVCGVNRHIIHPGGEICSQENVVSEKNKMVNMEDKVTTKCRDLYRFLDRTKYIITYIRLPGGARNQPSSKIEICEEQREWKGSDFIIKCEECSSSLNRNL